MMATSLEINPLICDSSILSSAKFEIFLDFFDYHSVIIKDNNIIYDIFSGIIYNKN